MAVLTCLGMRSQAKAVEHEFYRSLSARHSSKNVSLKFSMDSLKMFKLLPVICRSAPAG